MSGKTIATIYLYTISAASLVLIVIGIFNAVYFVINSTRYEKYPPRFGWGPYSSCDAPYDVAYGPPYPAKLIQTANSSPSAEEWQRAKEICLKNEEAERKQHKIDDLRNSITFTLVGLVLFSIHFPLARKQSKS